MLYKVVTGTTSSIQTKVQKLLDDGWVLNGSPFNTGNKIRISGDPAYPGTCDYTVEIGQSLFKITIPKECEA